MICILNWEDKIYIIFFVFFLDVVNDGRIGENLWRIEFGVELYEEGYKLRVGFGGGEE